MLSQSSSLSDAIELLAELTVSLRKNDSSHPRLRTERPGQTSPDSCEGSLSQAVVDKLYSHEIESFYNSLTQIKSLLLEERGRQQKTESQNIKINQQLASALSSTSLHAESLKKQLQQAKSSKNNEVTDYNSSGSERENLNREIKLLTDSKSRLQEGIADLEKRMGSIGEAGKRYEGLRQADLQMNLGVSDLEINRLREEVNVHIADKKKLRNDKQDLVSTLKQLYSALDEKEGETSTMIKSYDRRLAEKDELLTVTLNEKKELEVELTVQSREQKEYSRRLKLEIGQLQKKLQEYESASDADHTRRTRSPTESSWGNKSQNSHGHSSSQLESHSFHNIQHDSVIGSEETGNSDYSKPNKATGVAEVSKRAENNNVYMNGKGAMETSPQYATVGPPARQKDKQKHHSYTESSLTKSLDRDLNNQSGVSLFNSQFSSFRMSERKNVPNHLKTSQSVEHMSPLLPYKQQGVQRDKVTRTRSRSMNANEVETDKLSAVVPNNNNGNIFSHSLSRIFTRNKRKKHAQNKNLDRTSSFVQPPTYSNLPPHTSNSAKHKLLDSKGIPTPQREAPPPPPPIPKHLSSVSHTASISPKLQRSYSSLTNSIFGSEERKIGLLEETRKVHISRWNHITVLAWMDVRLGMTKYLQSALNVIQSGQTLLELTDSDFETKLGIVNPVHKRKLMLAIEDSRRPQHNPHPTIHEMDHYWVAQIWLPRLGLSSYSKLFYSNLVDGRVLRSLGKREADELLKIAPRIDQLSLMNGIKLLKHFNFNKDMWHESLNTEPVFWDNERMYTWLQSVNLMEYADQVLSSGVHGALVCLEPSFTYETLAYIMNIPQNGTEHRRSLRRHLESLTNTFNGFSSQTPQENSLTRSYSVPRSYTTPHHGYVADKTQNTNSYNRGFTQDSATSLSRNLSLSFNSSRQSVIGRHVESTPV